MRRFFDRLLTGAITVVLMFGLALPAKAGVLHKTWVIIKAPFTIMKDMFTVGLGAGCFDVLWQYEKPDVKEKQ